MKKKKETFPPIRNKESERERETILSSIKFLEFFKEKKETFPIRDKERDRETFVSSIRIFQRKRKRKKCFLLSETQRESEKKRRYSRR